MCAGCEFETIAVHPREKSVKTHARGPQIALTAAKLNDEDAAVEIEIHSPLSSLRSPPSVLSGFDKAEEMPQQPEEVLHIDSPQVASEDHCLQYDLYD